MGRIAVLPDQLCNQIAAGEVVERPAAVVKELTENSIDAGSRRISVSLLQGGRKEIRVVDDGCGMGPDDALMALERHATSKIRTLDDLQSVRSLGFRGEALSSIAAVSRFELVSREPEAVSGTCIRLEGGVLRDVRETGCAAGTSITVRDLFHNVPARRKFLRSVDTEMGIIGDQFMRLAMAHPHIHFQLVHQERVAYDFPKAKGHLERLLQVLGVDHAGSVGPVAAEHHPYEIHGFVGAPHVHRANARSLFVFVNQRPVWYRLVNQAILRAYDTLLPKGKFPLVVLFLKMPPELVDVNVHPTKREIRLGNPGQVLELAQDAVERALQELQAGRRSYHMGPHGAQPSDLSQRPAHGMRETQVSLENRFDPVCPIPTAVPPRQIAFPSGISAPLPVNGVQSLAADEAADDRLFFSRLPVLGQLANTYILLEAPDGLIMIDQHAAHERILYDQLSSSWPGESGRQRLTRSSILDLLPREAGILRRWMEKLREAGFEIEPFGPQSFIVQAVPAALSDHSAEVLLREALETAEEEQQSPNWDLLAGLAKTAACHAAIRAGQKLRREEIQHMLSTLDRQVPSPTCPHGRPFWCKVTHNQIARLFNRT